jgi:hypothetical protein
MNSNPEAGLAQNWNFSPDFPELPPDLIERPHLLHTIVDVLSPESPVLFLEGEEGDGATTTLAQLCREYPTQTFSLFIKPASRFAYSLDYLRLSLAEQFYWYVHDKALPQDWLNDIEFNSLRLKTLANSKGKPLYFVVDGLHQIPAEDRQIVASIFSNILPLGVGKCRFIITGQQASLSQYLHGSIKSKTYQLLKFKLDECKSFLLPTGLSDAECGKVYELCKLGSPGRLAAVRRLLLGGMTLSSILENDPTQYLEFVKLEFEVLDHLTADEMSVVAAIAYAKMVLSVEDLASLLNTRVGDVEAVAAKCQFLRVTPSRSVEFISETHRQFAAKKLDSIKREALRAQLDYLQRNPRSEMSLRYLPVYYETLNQQQAIIDLLSAEHFVDVLESTQSLSALRARAELGTRSAMALKQINEVFKFSLQRSLFTNSGTARATSAQIRALVATGKTNTALALANAEATKEDRLVLLSAFARRAVEKHRSIDSELAAYIRSLVDSVDFSALGDKAVKIAADILLFDPDAAIGIIESAVKGATAAVKDAAYAELSLSASLAKLKYKAQVDNKASARISDEALQQLAHSFEVITEHLDPAQLTPLLASMPAAHQIYFLRSVVNLKRQDPRVLDLVELGLDTMIRESEYVPRARDLAELAAPFLEPATDIDRLKGLVARFDSQLGLVAKTAQSRDLTVLQMRLAAAEYQYGKRLARDRVEQTYFDVSDMKAPEAKMECYAVMLGALTRLDKHDELEAADGFRALLRGDLANLLDIVLKDTADQLAAISPVLKVLAQDDCAAALQLAARLNTLHRRNTAYGMVVRVLLGQSYSEIRFQAAKRGLEAMTDVDRLAATVVSLLSALDANGDKKGWVPHLESFRPYLMRATQLSDWDCWNFKSAALAECEYPTELFLDRCREAVARAASPLEESEVLFKASEALSAAAPELAWKCYEDGVGVASTTPFSTQPSSKQFELCISLVGRALSPLARANLLDDDKLSRVEALIDNLPGLVPRARVLNELAERMWCARRTDLTTRIVQEQIRPLIEDARLVHPAVARAVCAAVFPSVCASHQQLALPILEEFGDVQADDAVVDAAMLRLRHLPRQEPDANGRIDSSRIDAGDILDVIQLLDVARSDSTVYYVMKTLVDAINDRNNRTRFTAQQKADWAARLRTIVDRKFPDKKNITHDGFKIVSTALVYALTDTGWSSWVNLESNADQIDNAADRAFIFLAIALALPVKHNTHRKRLLERALEEINKIPSPLDRLSHLQGYAEDTNRDDASGKVKDCLRAAMTLSIELADNSRAAEHQRELIDLADQVDPGLADELIQLVDDDPARVRLKAEATHAAAVAKAKRQMANARAIKDAGKCDLALLPSAAWKNLASLEAGRLETKPVEVTTEYVIQAGSGNLYDAYPVISWHLANLERKFVRPQEISTNITPICEALLLCAELNVSILSKIAGRSVHLNEDSEEEDGLLVRRKSRSDALEYVERWLRENAGDEIVYCDAYFTTRDVSLLRICLAEAPASKVYVLASKPLLASKNELGEEFFAKAWKEQSDQNPPETEIIALSYADAPTKHVIHDRWLLTNGSGLRLGTSFGSVGEERLSELSDLSDSQVTTIRAQIDKYLSRQRIVDGAKIQYSSFTL